MNQDVKGYQDHRENKALQEGQGFQAILGNQADLAKEVSLTLKVVNPEESLKATKDNILIPRLRLSGRNGIDPKSFE